MDKLINFRIINSKSKTGNNKLFRSAGIDFYFENDLLNIIRNNKISVWLDLRANDEISRTKNYLILNGSMKNYPMSSDEHYKLPKKPNENDYLFYYKKILEDNSPVIKEIILYLSDLKPGENICLSCYAGKDRTGIVSYILQNILGYEKKYIKDSYTLSGNELYKERIIFDKNAKNKNLSIDEYAERFLLSDKIFDLFDKYFKYKFENIDKYLNLIGVPSLQLEKIRKIFGD